MTVADARAPRTVAMLLVCSAAAWLALLAVSASPWEGAFEHGALENIGAHRWELSTLAAGWVLMVAAMMLPTTQPLVALFARFTAGRPDGGRLLAIVLAVYMLVWVVIGAVMHVADFGIHHLVDHSRWLDAHSVDDLGGDAGARRRLPAQRLEGALRDTLPHAAEFHPPPLARTLGGYRDDAAGTRPCPVLRRVLLGADARDVLGRCREHRHHGCADGGDDGGEDAGNRSPTLDSGGHRAAGRSVGDCDRRLRRTEWPFVTST